MTELNVYVAASSDDAEESGAPAAPNLTSADLDFYAGSTSWVLLRFLGVTIPPGSTIDAAVVRFQSAATFSGLGHAQYIYCQDADDAPTATTDVGDISSRSLTSASSAWTPPATTQNSYYDTADFAAALQEVVDRPGWAGGQAVVVLFRGGAANDNRSEMYSWDSSGAPPQIRIAYTAPTPPPPPPPPVTTPASRPHARLLVADRTGRILTEVEPQLGPVSWRLNGVGRATLTFAKTDPKAIEDYLRFGNRLLIQFANGLPHWGGVIDPPRRWGRESIQVTAYSGEYLLGMRQTGRGRDFDGATVGYIFQQLLQEANAVAPTGVAPGSVWGGGSTHSPAYHFDNLLKIIQESLTERLSAADFVVLAAEVNGYVTFTAHLYERRGRDAPGVVLLEDHNLAGIELDEQGPIVNCWDVAGQGTTWGEERSVAHAEDGASEAAYGRRQGSRVQADTAPLATLEEVARNELTETAWPRRVLTLEAADLAPARFADYDVGDRVRVVLHGYGFGGYDGLVRLLTREYDPAKGTCALVVQEA